MADMYGALRSNEFRVKNVTDFKAWFFTYSFGEEIKVWVDTKDSMDGPDDYSGKVSFGGEEQYPNAYPMVKIFDKDGYVEETEEADLDVFAAELRQHLMPGEVFQVIAGGNEKLRYVGFAELIIAEDVVAPSFRTYYSDDNKDRLRDRLNAGRDETS